MTSTRTEPKGYIGAAVPRKEDYKFLTGQGQYMDDLSVRGMLHACFVRSPHAHALIRAIRTDKALALPGVVAVATGEDLAKLTTRARVALEGCLPMEMTALPVGKVRFVGDPVACVVATDRYVAEDAAELVEVAYEPLPAVTDFREAAEPGAPLVDADLPTNLVADQTFEYGNVDAAFAEADLIVETEFRQHRQTHTPMEPRGVLAVWDNGSKELTFYNGAQVPHPLRTNLAGRLGLTENQVRVISPDVGGGFGQKIPLYREELTVAALAMKLNRPVKWIEDRAENLLAANMAREDWVKTTAAVRKDGTILGLKAELWTDFGAYAFYPPNYMIRVVGMILPGPYRISNYAYNLKASITNKCPAGPMRAPMAIVTWATEGTIENIAAQLGLDPVEVRRRNMITLEEQPYEMISGYRYEALTLRESLDLALEKFDYGAFRAEQAAARAEGRYLGLGIASVVEPNTYGSAWYKSAGIPGTGHEAATVKIEPSGAVNVMVGIMTNGQGYETTIAQVVADGLGTTPTNVAVRLGDTHMAPYGMGTRGARGAAAGAGVAYLAAVDLRAKVLRLAAHLMGTSADALDLRENRIFVKDDGEATDSGAPSMTLAQLARTAYLDPLRLPPGMEPGLELHKTYDPPPLTFSNATHLCVVDVDPQTGAVRIPRYLIVEDAGTLINPTVVDGQIQGATAMGISGVLLEQVVYDKTGQNLTGTFADYLLMSAAEAPALEIHHLQTPSPNTPKGIKGMAEGGVMGAIAAVCLGVQDALRPVGAVIDTQPLSPSRILSLFRQYNETR